jgi:hypothetical protein
LLLLSLCCGREEQWGCLLEEDSHATLDSSLPTPTRSNARSSTGGRGRGERRGQVNRGETEGGVRERREQGGGDVRRERPGKVTMVGFFSR